MRGMQRRQLLIGLGPAAVLGFANPLAAQAPPEPAARFAQRLREGGVAVLLRHAITEPGVGDPPGFKPGECGTQRNLSAEGREQALRIGAWFASRGLVPAAVRASAWCRCIDTAQLAFGRATVWAPLSSSFGARSAHAPQHRPQLVEALGRIRPRAFEVWVTHQTNITAWTGAGIAMGEGFVVAPPPGADREAALPIAVRLWLGG